MFEPASRYANVETAQLTVIGPDGQPRVLAYLRRRIIPDVAGTTLVQHTVIQGDRLDNVTARYLGDPLQFWRIADANGALRPEELTGQPGRVVRIVLPNG
jgi:hypothetical protein